jgi:hypothetical protein
MTCARFFAAAIAGGLDGAEKRGRPIDGVEQANQDAFFAAQAETAQHMAEPLDAVGEIGIAVFAAMIDEGDLVGAAGVEIALQDVGGEIVVARHRGRGWQLALWRFARLNEFHPTCILVVCPPEHRGPFGSGRSGHYADGATGRNPLQHDPEK